MVLLMDGLIVEDVGRSDAGISTPCNVTRPTTTGELNQLISWPSIVDENAEEEQHHGDTGLETNMNAHEDDTRTRSAPSSVRTSNNANTSIKSSNSEGPVDGDTPQAIDVDVNVPIGEGSYIEERIRTRIHAIDLWDERMLARGEKVGFVG